MTTIAVSRKHGMMAGDKQFTHRSGMKLTGQTKIYEVPHPEIYQVKRAFIGFAGGATNIAAMVGWLHDPTSKLPKANDFEALLLNDKNEIYHTSNMSNWTLLKDKFCAIGSGQPFAMAAMLAGEDPAGAVKIASKLDSYTGMGITKLVM